MIEPQDWRTLWDELHAEDAGRGAAVERDRLRQRARQYAEPLPEDDHSLAVLRPVLSFELGAERYAVDVGLVHGVRDNLRLVRVPGAPPYYPGVMNVRGQIITALDLRRFFGLDPALDGAPAREALLVRAGRLTLALLARTVLGVQELPAESVHPVENLPYTHGITAERLIVLDLPLLCEDDRLFVGEKI